MTDDKRPAYHLVPAISNIHNFTPFILDQDSIPYSSWVALFTVTTKSHRVLNHIDATIDRPMNVDDSLNEQLDVVILQWIYNNISKELIITILDPKNIALTA